jgi:hypothetical protein
MPVLLKGRPGPVRLLDDTEETNSGPPTSSNIEGIDPDEYELLVVEDPCSKYRPTSTLANMLQVGTCGTRQSTAAALRANPIN